MESIEKISESIPDEVTPETKTENEVVKALYEVGEKISGLIMIMTEENAKKDMETDTDDNDDNDDNDDIDVETEIDEKGDNE